MSGPYFISREEEFSSQLWGDELENPVEIMQSIYDILARIMDKIPVESRGQFRFGHGDEWAFNDKGKVIYGPSKIKRGFFSQSKDRYFNIWIEKEPYKGQCNTLFINVVEYVSRGEVVGYGFQLRSHLKDEPFYPLVEEEYKQLFETIPELEEGHLPPSRR